jgi:hypothetical protein
MEYTVIKNKKIEEKRKPLKMEKTLGSEKSAT